MNIEKVRESIGRGMPRGFDFYERRPGIHQIIVPILHEDGDMVDIYVQDSPKGDGYVRGCDVGMTLMRLSYVFDAHTPTRERILESVLINNGVKRGGDGLYLDAPIGAVYQSVLQFAGCVQKVCNMRYWNRETVRSAFYDDLNEYVENGMKRFSPVQNYTPMPVEGYDVLGVDWFLTHNGRGIYLFGVRGDDKAKNVAISLLEFQKANLPFISIVAHEDMDALGKREKLYLTNNADIQYSRLDEFKKKSAPDILRVAAAQPLAAPATPHTAPP